MENVFDRIALFRKEKPDEGKQRIKRIPWDLISIKGGGFMVSPMPIPANMFGETSTSTTASEIYDMLDDDTYREIDEVIDIEFFESEAVFTSKFENVFGFWDEDNAQSKQFGYPCASGI